MPPTPSPPLSHPLPQWASICLFFCFASLLACSCWRQPSWCLHASSREPSSILPCSGLQQRNQLMTLSGTLLDILGCGTSRRNCTAVVLKH
uniref:Putative secreted protein n=1 Tax=Ixodes scapularis TaxID=6945 RepID=A0A4D5RE36_IXOSC